MFTTGNYFNDKKHGMRSELSQPMRLDFLFSFIHISLISTIYRIYMHYTDKAQETLSASQAVTKLFYKGSRHACLESLEVHFFLFMFFFIYTNNTILMIIYQYST